MLFLCRPVATLHCRFLCGAATVVLVPVAVAVAAVPLGGCGFGFCLCGRLWHSSISLYYRLLMLLENLLIFWFSVNKETLCLFRIGEY